MSAGLAGSEEASFYRHLYAAYSAALPILAEICDEVKSEREISSVVDSTARFEVDQMSKVDSALMWRTGETTRKGNIDVRVEPSTAGIYLGVMMAQIDVLQKNGHAWIRSATRRLSKQSIH